MFEFVCDSFEKADVDENGCITWPEFWKYMIGLIPALEDCKEEVY